MRLSPPGEDDETYAVAQSYLTSFDCWGYPSFRAPLKNPRAWGTNGAQTVCMSC
jgi:hypothetical protein